MRALLLMGLWALLLQWGMLFFVRFRYRTWSWGRQHLVAGLILPVAVVGMAAWIWFDPASCSAAHPDGCPQVYGTAMLALMMAGLLVVAAALLLLVDRVRRRP